MKNNDQYDTMHPHFTQTIQVALDHRAYDVQWLILEIQRPAVDKSYGFCMWRRIDS